MILSAENYFSPEASREYMSVSQYKNFAGTLGMKGCEEYALALLSGAWKEEPSPAMTASSYVDCYFEGTLPSFKKQHPEIFTKDGKELRSDFKHMETIIKRIERDEYFMKCLSGEKQVIYTGEIFGMQWKGKLDSFLPDTVTVDLKIMKSIRDTFYVPELYRRLSFVEYYGYDIQAAIYQKIVEINTGKKLPFLIACASKEAFPDIEVLAFTQGDLDKAMGRVFQAVGRIHALKSGQVQPTRCEECDWCHTTKVLRKPIHYSELTK